MTIRPFESQRNFQFNEFQRQPEHQHLQPQPHELKGLGHQRHQQSHKDSDAMVHSGHLPGVEVFAHHPEKKPKHPGQQDAAAPNGHGHGEKLADGTVKFGSLKGAAVDTDGSGAHRHTEDRDRRSHTAYQPGGKSLDTDKDSYVALPKSVMKEHGIQLGDHGFLVRSDTGQKVPVVFGDVSSGKQWRQGEPEASVAALKGLGFNKVTGANGVDRNVNFELIMAPGSRGRYEV